MEFTLSDGPTVQYQRNCKKGRIPMSVNESGQELKKSFSPLGIWAFSIGTSLGWGSFIVTCNTYLQKSGTLGMILGLIVGTGVFLVVARNLHYVIKNCRDAGGIYTFEKTVSGNDLGFLSGWFIILTYLSILWANVASIPLFTRFFLGNTFHFGFHYEILGSDVWFGEILLSFAVVVLIGLLITRSSKIPNLIMIIASLAFTIGFFVCALIIIAGHDNGFSYQPYFIENSNAFGQIVRITVISPWAFIGFESISHFSGEYNFRVKKIKSILISSILVTTVLYIFASLLSISAYPPEYSSWLSYISDMGNLSGIKAVPAFYAAQYYLGNFGIAILMISLFAVILTSLIGNMMALSRLLYAMGRDHDAPKSLGRLNKHSIPGKAVLVIVLASLFIPFLGRTPVSWLIDLATIGAMLIYGLMSYGVFKRAREQKEKTEQITGVAGIFLMIGFFVLLLVPGLLPFHEIEPETYILFILWGVWGLVHFRILIARAKNRTQESRIMVWGGMLALMIFASMMWVSRATEEAANSAFQNIYEHDRTHLYSTAEVEDEADHYAFLDKQADRIMSANALYTMVSLGLFIVSILVLANSYRSSRIMKSRLSEAQDAVRTAKMLAEYEKQQKLVERLKEERTAYSRISALTGDFVCLFVITPETGFYREYITIDSYRKFSIPNEGTDFFESAKEQAARTIYPEDLSRFLSLFNKKGVLEEIKEKGLFTMGYRMMLDGEPNYVQLKATMVTEDEGDRLIVGVTNIDAYVKQEKAYEKRLAQETTKANIDALTGIRNKYAYLEAAEKLDRSILENNAQSFAIVILDINDLKKVNDTKGHNAGDEMIRAACRIICDTFKKSPVFRVGGDEFAVIPQGNDYDNIDTLMASIGDRNEKAKVNDEVVIACGMARFDRKENKKVEEVFERADKAMYENKKFLKGMVM